MTKPRSITDIFSETKRIGTGLRYLRDLGFSPDNSIIIGSTSLFSTGALQIGKDGAPSDIDVWCKDRDLFQMLSLRHETTKGKYSNDLGLNLLQVHDDNPIPLEIYDRPIAVAGSMSEIFERSTCKCGVRFLSIRDQLNFMQRINPDHYRSRIETVMQNCFAWV